MLESIYYKIYTRGNKMEEKERKYKPSTECDVCGKKTNDLVDYYAMLCYKCKDKYGSGDLTVINRLGQSMSKIEDLELDIVDLKEEIKNGNTK